MSFERMEAARARGFVYTQGDYEARQQRHADNKLVHHFQVGAGSGLEDHRCAQVSLPKAVGRIRTLPSGQVAIYAELEGVECTLDRVQVLEREVEYELNSKSAVETEVAL